MDGKTLTVALRSLLDEDSNSGYIDSYTTYQFLNEAATNFVSRTKCLHSSQSITTVADQTTYDLNTDFMMLYLRDSQQRYVIKYSDGTSTWFLPWESYEKIFCDNNTDSVTTPSCFTVQNNGTLDTQVTGTATSAGAASGGQCTLTDTAGDFSDVSAGDNVHNTTDGSYGVVISKTSSTALVTALFGGTNDDWSSSDAYVIQPQGEDQLILDPPPSTASHTVTVPYVQRPAPVYSDYGVFKFPEQFSQAVVKYAAWLYKYRDREPNFGDKWYVMYDQLTKKYAMQVNNKYRRKTFQVRFK